MLALLALLAFGLLLARLLRAPAGSWRWILAGWVGLVLVAQLVPGAHAYQLHPATFRALGWLALAAIPVGAYALLLRNLRRRTGAGRIDAPPRPRGLVRIVDDARLAADTAAALAADTARATGTPPERLSFAWRGDDGEVAGHLRLAVAAGVGEIEQLLVAPGHRRQAIGARLVAAAGEAARERGALRLVAAVASWQTGAFFRAQGFRVAGELPLGDGASRAWFVRELGP